MAFSPFLPISDTNPLPITGLVGPLVFDQTTGTISGFATGAGLTLHGGGTITGASGAVDITASGTNQNITLTPSGTGVLEVGANGLLIPGGIKLYNEGNDGLLIITDAGKTTLTGVQFGPNSAAGLRLATNTGTTFAFRNGANSADAPITASTIGLSGKVSTYNAVTTAGWGVPAIQGAGTVTAQSARSAAIASYTVGAADGIFEVGGNVNVSVSTLHSFSLDVEYRDETDTPRVLILPVAQLAGVFVTGGLITNTTGTGPYETPAMVLRCKAATTITIRPSAGTFTTVTYSAAAHIKQVA